jgi:3-methyladenine DNA glycosylase AlkD
MRFIDELTQFFRQYNNEENAAAMAAYMRNKFQFLGIKTPERKELLKEFSLQYMWPDVSDLEKICLELWEQPEREFQYIAYSFLDKYKKKLSEDYFNLLERLIVSKSWWDTVDGLAANIAGTLLEKFPKHIPSKIETWMNSNNIWLQRTCILFQLKYKGKTNTDLLVDCIIKLAHSNEFFIQKAIGWALREYAKTNPEFVIEFCHNNQLKSLSKREALKNL